MNTLTHSELTGQRKVSWFPAVMAIGPITRMWLDTQSVADHPTDEELNPFGYIHATAYKIRSEAETELGNQTAFLPKPAPQLQNTLDLTERHSLESCSPRKDTGT
jgi:hypothetical protein